MTNDESSPVENDEFVLRRIHRNAIKIVLSPPILRIAFQPNENDDTGLSVYRERFVSAAGTLANIPAEKRRDYCVLRLAVRDVQLLGLNVVPEPDPHGPAGHAVVPELSWHAFQADKHRLKQIQVALAKLASSAIVLHAAANE